LDRDGAGNVELDSPTVVRPMVTYASFVWWQRTELKTAHAELQKVQRLACLLTIGAMKSAPTIALEAMLDLPPLLGMVKKEAAQSAFRMLDTYKPNTENMQGHSKSLQRLPRDNGTALTLRYIYIRYIL
jgi:hypothetical protein